ncbi:MAG: bifunctional (p)ppGpp synthetase/guanosine-3',5'-bis(diphosphate) 3'-pyrophosphohydrolase [Gammaproteobacteria bacterium AqS3]|nr:bifunctional (p)ppGpp synthetase/guanosine-3',5'-bis(diphosphate) 3'-pyrophosphohydrolase [Gammaproteobacteria bacterium AqS3]
MKSISEPKTISTEPLNRLLVRAAYLDSSERSFLEEAWKFAEGCHRGQLRASNDPYITHPTEVAILAADMHLDLDALRAALLHDVLEDSDCGIHKLRTEISPDVAQIVEALTKLKAKNLKRDHVDANTFRRFAQALQNDIRVGIIKICDRLHNMRTLQPLEAQKKRRIARQTLDLYVPLALRMGFTAERTELEDKCLEVLEPQFYEMLCSELNRTRGPRTRLFNAISKQVSGALAELDIEAGFYPDEFHANALYTRLKRNSRLQADSINVDDLRQKCAPLLRLLRMQIVVEDENTCYQVLGVLHRLYKPILERFADYIALPKDNDYKALRTVVFAPGGGNQVAIHIRTREMHERAVQGFAWYWRNNQPDAAQKAARPWLKRLDALSKITDDDIEFLHGAAGELAPNKLQTYSPQGDLFLLPLDACALDFAYAVHDELGHRAAGCRINNQIAPLDRRLQNGDMVEIIKSRKRKVQTSWLAFVTTPKAQGSIRKFYRDAVQSDAEKLGQRMLQETLEQMGTSLRAIGQTQRRELCQLLKLEPDQFSRVLKDIGMWQRHPRLIAQQLTNQQPHLPDEEALEIQGTEGLPVEFAPCCLPIPGDSIRGLMRPGSALQVHQQKCLDAHPPDGGGLIPLRWSDQKLGRSFDTQIYLRAPDRTKVLSSITQILSENNIFISGTQYTRKDEQADLYFKIQVENLVHLNEILKKLTQSKLVDSAERFFESPTK